MRSADTDGGAIGATTGAEAELEGYGLDAGLGEYELMVAPAGASATTSSWGSTALAGLGAGCASSVTVDASPAYSVCVVTGSPEGDGSDVVALEGSSKAAGAASAGSPAGAAVDSRAGSAGAGASVAVGSAVAGAGSTDGAGAGSTDGVGAGSTGGAGAASTMGAGSAGAGSTELASTDAACTAGSGAFVASAVCTIASILASESEEALAARARPDEAGARPLPAGIFDFAAGVFGFGLAARPGRRA